KASLEAIRKKLSTEKPDSISAGRHTVGHANLVSGADNLEELVDCRLVLEAIIEDLPAKTQLFHELSRVTAPECVLASNTSCLSIEKIAESQDCKDRILGLHFFYPVDKMPLVEVISHPQTSKAALSRALSFVTALGKVPVAIKDGPGFL